MAEQTEEFRSRIRRFLNTSRGRDVDPKEILEDLVSQKVLDAEEAGLVENEKTKTNRQFVSENGGLFLEFQLRLEMAQ